MMATGEGGSYVGAGHSVSIPCRNDYAGYDPSDDPSASIKRISADISPSDFFKQYVAQRKPVILVGHLTDSQWRGHLWTNRHLKDRVGNCSVIVERRGDTKEAAFGLTAPKVDMIYGDFLSEITKGNDRLYMTTQDPERFVHDIDDVGMPKSVMSEPLKSLSDDLPVRPSLLGHLIPYQLTLWQGLSMEGTSSGLHHDYHDNLYILIRGRKRFRLFPPSAAVHMRTAGTPVQIHSNGLIVYQQSGMDDGVVSVREDGVPLAFLAKKKKDDAELDLDEAEYQLEDLASTNLSDDDKARETRKLQEKIEECEQRIDDAMEEMLKYGMMDGGVHIDDEEGYYEDEEELEEPSTKKAKFQSVEQKKDETDTTDDSMKTDTHKNGEDLASYELKTPDHFCSIKLPTHSEKLDDVYTEYPELKKVGCLVCHVNPGEMIYLPASWFHEVTSFSVSEDPDPEVTHKDLGHLALNYWLFPPDSDCFEKPYKSDFWEDRWDDIQQERVRLSKTESEDEKDDNPTTADEIPTS